MARRVCTESEAACLAPAGYGISGLGVCEGDGSCKGTCWACGEPVCGNCSTRVSWGRHGVQRVCYGCQVGEAPVEARKALEKRIVARLQRLVDAGA